MTFDLAIDWTSSRCACIKAYNDHTHTTIAALHSFVHVVITLARWRQQTCGCRKISVDNRLTAVKELFTARPRRILNRDPLSQQIYISNTMRRSALSYSVQRKAAQLEKCSVVRLQA